MKNKLPWINMAAIALLLGVIISQAHDLRLLRWEIALMQAADMAVEPGIEDYKKLLMIQEKTVYLIGTNLVRLKTLQPNPDPEELRLETFKHMRWEISGAEFPKESEKRLEMREPH